MAIITEARMQQLRGKYNQLNKEALLPGEFAICDDHNPIVRTNTGYKELLTADNAEYFENKVTDINNAISSTNEAIDKANKAVADTLQATNDNTQRVDNALTQLETDTQQKFTELDTQVTNTVNGAVSDLNKAKEQAIADMEQATSDNTQRVDNAIQQIATKVGIDDTQSSTLTTYSSDKIDKLFEGVSGKPYKIVTSLPETGDKDTLYFVPSASPESNNVYDEYMYIDGMWEYIGSKAINIEDISESRVDTIEEVGERTPISATDKMKLIVGKIVKTFADIKNIAFSGSIADITDFDTVLSTSLLSTESGKRALDEVVGKILNDKIEEIKNLQGSTNISDIGDGSVTGALSVLNSNLLKIDNKSKYYASYYINNPVSTVTIDVPFKFAGCMIIVCVGASWTRQTIKIFLCTTWYGSSNFKEIASSNKGTAYNIILSSTERTLTIDAGDDVFGYHTVSII